MDGQAPEDRYRFEHKLPLTKIYVQVTGLPQVILVGECDGFDYSYEGSVTDDGIESEWTLTIRDPNRELLRGLGFRFPGDHPPPPEDVPPTAEIPAPQQEPTGATRAPVDPDGAATTVITTEETTTP
jgi:hypothetical protein